MAKHPSGLENFLQTIDITDSEGVGGAKYGHTGAVPRKAPDVPAGSHFADLKLEV